MAYLQCEKFQKILALIVLDTSAEKVHLLSKLRRELVAFGGRSAIAHLCMHVAGTDKDLKLLNYSLDTHPLLMEQRYAYEQPV